MCYMISISGISCAIKSFVIISLACSYQSVVASEINALNLCTRNHCEDCSGSESLKCSNDAVSNRCGDLCHCCHSCVQFRGVGESCGSQLAVRSLEYLQKSTSRVTILATSRCKKGLICNDFACEKIDGSANVDINDRKAFEFENKDARKESDYFPSFIDNSLSITSTREILTAIESRDSEIFSEKTETRRENDEKVSLDPSGHLINVIVGTKEFQLIYGRKIIEDFDFLIKSIDKSGTDSIIKEYEVKILSERFKDIFELLISSGNESSDAKAINPFSTSNPSSQELNDTVRDAEASNIRHNFYSRARYSPQVQSSSRKLRKKRGLDDIEKSEDVEINGGISVYDIVNKTPRQIDDFGRYFIARKVEKSPEEKSSSGETVDNDKYESEINIHISGVPRITDTNLEGNKTEEENNEVARNDKNSDQVYKIDDNSEIFESTQNNDVTTVFSEEDKSINSAVAEIANEKTLKSDTADNVTEDFQNNYERTQLFHNDFQFTFPENPVTLEDDSNRNSDVIFNETADEFRAQLDRIETRAIIIENAVFDIKRKIDVNQGYQNIENRKINIKNVELIREKGLDELTRDVRIPRRRKIIRLSKIPIYNRPSSNNSENESIEDKRTKHFRSDRSNRHWRTVRLRPDAFEAPKYWKDRRFLQNRNEENKIIDPGTIPRHSKPTRGSNDSERSNHRFSPRTSSSMKIFKVLPKVLSQRKFPIFLTRSDLSGANFFHRRQSDPQLFSREQSNFEVNSNFPHAEPVWPMNLVIDRALPADRTDRKIEEDRRVRGRNLKPEVPMAEESIILLETQIPKSINPANSMTSDQQVASMNIIEKHKVNDSWSFEEEKPALNLFLVNEKNSGLRMMSSNSKIPETLVLPMESLYMKISLPRSEEVRESYSTSPLYSDYGERPEIDDEGDREIVESEPSGTPLNEEKNGTEGSSTNRKKRDVSDVSSQPRESTESIARTINSNVYDVFPMIDRTKEKSRLSKSLDGGKNVDPLRNERKTGTKSRSRRNVKMIDWLRAAQEYHERLRQVRNAAMKTWLASREILTDTNLTNVKLFTSEVPPYLDKYRPTIFHRDFEDGRDNDKSEDYSTEFRELDDSIGDSSEILTDIFAEYSSLGKNESSRESNENEGSSESSNLSGRKKFTIIADGNSTIRIEDIPKDEDDTGADQVGQSTTDREIHKVPISIKESDYFDHMYESFDADDEDFNYDDPTSGWFDRFDIIDSSTSETSENNNDKSPLNSSDKEEEDSSGRLKRDSPLILFKVKGNPKKEIIIWPSNWRDLIDRHLRHNRDGDAPQRATRRKSYTRLRKIDPKLSPASFESIATEELKDDER